MHRGMHGCIHRAGEERLRVIRSNRAETALSPGSSAPGQCKADACSEASTDATADRRPQTADRRPQTKQVALGRGCGGRERWRRQEARCTAADASVPTTERAITTNGRRDLVPALDTAWRRGRKANPNESPRRSLRCNDPRSAGSSLSVDTSPPQSTSRLGRSTIRTLGGAT
jgi:hypothetical protein